MSYIIVDLDGTLVLENEQPNQPLIDALNEEVMSGDKQIIVVSARKIDRLQETRAWLQENKVAGVEEVHLNDFEGSAFATGFAFKEYKYGLLKEQYGEELEYAIDNDPAVREMARVLDIEAYSPEEYLADEERAVYEVPDYIRNAAARGLSFVEDGYAGEGLQPQTIAEARELAAGRADTDKVIRMAAWIRRHRGDWEVSRRMRTRIARTSQVQALLLAFSGVWKRLTATQLIAYSRGQTLLSQLKIGRLLI